MREKSMRPDYSYWSSVRVRTIFGVLGTLLAWTASGSLFIVLRLIPLTHGAPGTIYSTTLVSLLPWLAGSVFWTRVRKRAKLGIADRDAAGFCYTIVFITVGAAYVALLSIEPVLLMSFTRVH
jgi:hypothetical protein